VTRHQIAEALVAARSDRPTGQRQGLRAARTGYTTAMARLSIASAEYWSTRCARLWRAGQVGGPAAGMDSTVCVCDRSQTARLAPTTCSTRCGGAAGQRTRARTKHPAPARELVTTERIACDAYDPTPSAIAGVAPAVGVRDTRMLCDAGIHVDRSARGAGRRSARKNEGRTSLPCRPPTAIRPCTPARLSEEAMGLFRDPWKRHSC